MVDRGYGGLRSWMDPALGVLRVVLWFQEIAASGVWEGRPCGGRAYVYGY